MATNATPPTVPPMIAPRFADAFVPPAASTARVCAASVSKTTGLAEPVDVTVTSMTVTAPSSCVDEDWVVIVVGGGVE